MRCRHDILLRDFSSSHFNILMFSDVELFCGITPLRARPTRDALRGIYTGPGERRGAPRPARTFDELLQGIVVTR